MTDATDHQSAIEALDRYLKIELWARRRYLATDGYTTVYRGDAPSKYKKIERMAAFRMLKTAG